MALQTREQHIKREKATSNICTAQVLLAVMAGMYAVYHGPDGLKYIANKIHSLAKTLSDSLQKIGLNQLNEAYFDTLKVTVTDAQKAKVLSEEKEINFLIIDSTTIGISINETTTLDSIKEIVAVLAKAEGKDIPTIEVSESNKVLSSNMRTSTFMQHSVFNSYHSETEMMRYIKKLERKDISLTDSMISLGSCTMKLNAASEMLPLSYGSWNNIHPFVPIEHVQ